MDDLADHLGEDERQLVLLALAVLSLQSPGFEDALNRIASRIDTVKDGRAEMYDDFRRCRSNEPAKWIEASRLLAWLRTGSGATSAALIANAIERGDWATPKP